MSQINNLRKIHSYGNTLIEWASAIQEAIRTKDTTVLNNLKYPEGFTQEDYNEITSTNNRTNSLRPISRDYVSELSDENTRRNNKLLRLSTDYGRRK